MNYDPKLTSVAAISLGLALAGCAAPGADESAPSGDDPGVAAQEQVAATKRCYQLSLDGDVWARTPELLCVANDVAATPAVPATLTLETGLFEPRRVVATFVLELTSRCRCADKNQDTFGVANPSNSIFNTLAVRFDGTRAAAPARETGVVTIGETRYFYRSF